MTVGVLRIDLHLPMAQTLKDKRSVLKSIRVRLDTWHALRCGPRRPDARKDDADVPTAVRQGGVTPQIAGWGRNPESFK